jgi:ribosomal protein RSM22 (predicted rRNA methylase)
MTRFEGHEASCSACTVPAILALMAKPSPLVDAAGGQAPLGMLLSGCRLEPTLDLPAPLRLAIDALLDGRRVSDLAASRERLSARYRPEVRDGRLHVGDEAAALAYLAARFPATWAALRSSFIHAEERLDGFAPRSVLDIGAGPGTATLAALDAWPGIERATLVEASPAMRKAGGALLGAREATWLAGDARTLDLPRADLVVLGYVLGELAPVEALRLVGRLWEAGPELLVVTDPGTPAGWRRMLEVRGMLVARGAHLVAPCPHALDCPVHEPDWCHFSVRLARSRLHRLAKGAERPFEDEPFTYLAVSRQRTSPVAARVLSAPRAASGMVTLKLCRADGALEAATITRREGERFREARRRDWGDVLE